MFGFGLLRAIGVIPAALAASAWIFCTAFARAWGPGAMQVGNLLTVVAVLALDHPTDLDRAALLTAQFALGSLWALLLTMVIWRVHPYRPARTAVASVYRRLAVLAADLSDQLTADTHPDWAAHARAHRRYVRDGIEAARTEVMDALRARGPGVPRTNTLLIQIEAADQIFGAVIALSDILESGIAEARQGMRPVLPALRLLLAAIADAILGDETITDPQRDLFKHLLAAIEQGQQQAALAELVHALLEKLRVAALMTTPDGWTLGGVDDGNSAATLTRVLTPLRSNLSWESAALRHAVRASVVALPALLVTLPSSATYAHWLTITLILTLQPFFALTWQRAVERVAGTVLGGVIAAALAVFIHGPVATAALIFPLAVFAFTVRKVSFGLFMAGLTPLVVLLSELGQPGTSELTIALWRAGYTIAGGTMAVLGGLLLWPSWEPPRVMTDLREALRSHAAYAEAEMAVLMGEAPPEAADRARRAAGLASNTLETTLARALQEPGHDSRRELQGAMLADAALRRVAGRLAALQHAPGLAGSAALAEWRSWLAQGFAALEAGTPLPSNAPADAAMGTLARLARQLTMIDGALRQAGDHAQA